MEHLEVHPIEHMTPAGYAGVVGIIGSVIAMALLIWKRRTMPVKSFWAFFVFALVVGFVSATIFLPIVDVVTKLSSGGGHDDGR